MTLCRRSRFHFAAWLPAPLILLTFTGCASPGLPRPPSLQIPIPTKDLSVLRRGNTVELQFTLPQKTTDNQPLYPTPITASVCRAVDSGPCKMTTTSKTFPMPDSAPAELIDTLPPELSSGSPHLLTYRVRLANTKGRFGEWSLPASATSLPYAASGSAPPDVHGLSAQGSRLGLVLQWQHEEDGGSKVVLRREDTNPKPQKSEKTTDGALAHLKLPTAHKTATDSKDEPDTLFLDAGVDSASISPATLDTTVIAEDPYLYSAERIRTVTVGGHTLEVHSNMSNVLSATLHDTFPPLVPTDLTVVGFVQPAQEGAAAVYAADLIWQPVDDANLAGYNVFRQALDASSSPIGAKTRLNAEPVALPAFHDATADPKRQYRYSVTAVDRKGNESEAVTTILPVQPE